MKNDIKTVYLDTRGFQHATKSDAVKASRLFAAAEKFFDAIGVERDDIKYLIPESIEYARAVVSIHGMKDDK